ncbi:MAG: hypothetical protein OXT74_12650, partial [Candidatus Poribacteria bacterium]|nr:hypothetical protein [Candidatus Poribacteria bacterium]
VVRFSLQPNRCTFVQSRAESLFEKSKSVFKGRSFWGKRLENPMILTLKWSKMALPPTFQTGSEGLQILVHTNLEIGRISADRQTFRIKFLADVKIKCSPRILTRPHSRPLGLPSMLA